MMLMRDEIKGAIEAILFAKTEGLSIEELVEILDVPLLDLKIILKEMIEEYNEVNRGIQIVVNTDRLVLGTKPAFSDILNKLIKPIKRRLSPAAMETLAIIAYQQPVTRNEIEKIRGVKVEKVLANLYERGLVEEVGHKQAPGKPVLYGTTTEFLRVFGLTSLNELPALKGDNNKSV